MFKIQEFSDPEVDTYHRHRQWVNARQIGFTRRVIVIFDLSLPLLVFLNGQLCPEIEHTVVEQVFIHYTERLLERKRSIVYDNRYLPLHVLLVFIGFDNPG